MRRTCLQTIYELAKANPDVVFIGSDLGAGTLDEFKRDMPERFFMEGISEGHIAGMAAGLAMSGKIVYVNTIAVFLTRRCFEQNVIDLALSGTRVRLIGNGGGLVYAPLGPTHLAIEDIAIMRAIPGMTVVVPADAPEVARVIRASEHLDGPMYIRLAKGGDPVVTDVPHGFALGRAYEIGDAGRLDVAFIANGVMLWRALAAAEVLRGRGLRCSVLNVHTVKPLDEAAVGDMLERSRVVMTVEEHLIHGGLGSAVAELVAESAWRRAVVFRRFGLPDAFPDGYGSQDGLLARYGLTPDQLRDAALQLRRQAAG